MQWILDHWFELAATALLGVITINTVDTNWQILVTRRRDAVSRRNSGR
jgi:hypothetical protein